MDYGYLLPPKRARRETEAMIAHYDLSRTAWLVILPLNTAALPVTLPSVVEFVPGSMVYLLLASSLYQQRRTCAFDRQNALMFQHFFQIVYRESEGGFLSNSTDFIWPL